MGTSAHAFTLLHDHERDAFRAQVDSLGRGTTLLVDTYDVTEAVRTAVEVAGPELGAVRIDSGDLLLVAHRVRQQLDELGAKGTRIIVTSDLDEYAIASLAVAPVDAYGVGTQLVTGSGHPTASMVYKLVARAESDDPKAPLIPVAKKSSGGKTSIGGRKWAAHAAGRGGDRGGRGRGHGGGSAGCSRTGSCWWSWSRAARSSRGSRWTSYGTGMPPPGPTCRCRRCSCRAGNLSFRRSMSRGARVANAGAPSRGAVEVSRLVSSPTVEGHPHAPRLDRR